MQYTDEELRVLFIPQAIKMMESDVFASQRTTPNIAAIVAELVRIARTGSVTKQPDTLTIEEQPQTEMKFA